MRFLTIIGLSFALVACGDAPASESDEQTEFAGMSGDDSGQDEDIDEDSSSEESYEDEAVEAERYFDEDRARDEARADVNSETYSGVGRPYGCTIDCSGHDAGFEWARDRELEDCWGGRSQSFAEGCRTYGEEIDRKVEEARDEFESGADEYSTEW